MFCRLFKNIHTPSGSTGSTLNALRAKSAKNKLAFSNHSLAQRTRARLGHVVPVDILNIAAPIANEMVMAHALKVESSGAALDRNFTYQACSHQVAQIVISRSPRRARICTIHGLKNFRSRRMSLMIRKESHHRIALRSATQAAALQGLLD
jgi:K+-transporting ATPase c subunit